MALKINDNGIDRDMTSSEEAAYLAWQVIAQAETQADADAKIAKQVARQAVLNKLGLTQDEAQAVLG